jgi:hypothetical protein
MKISALILFLLINTAWAEVGKITKVIGDQDSYLVRGTENIKLVPEASLELGDIIHSQNSYIVIHLYPATQMSLAKNSEIKISEHMIEENADVEKTTSVIDFIKGIVRLQVTKDANQEIDQKVQANGVSFGVRGTEFEVSLENNQDVDLDVFEGEVQASSPYIHSFVPEIVKANEGFRFERKKKAFSKRRFAPKFRNHPGFKEKNEIKKQWREIKEKRKAAKASNRAEKKAEKQRTKALRKSEKRANKANKKGSR